MSFTIKQLPPPKPVYANVEIGKHVTISSRVHGMIYELNETSINKSIFFLLFRNYTFVCLKFYISYYLAWVYESPRESQINFLTH